MLMRSRTIAGLLYNARAPAGIVEAVAGAVSGRTIPVGDPEEGPPPAGRAAQRVPALRSLRQHLHRLCQHLRQGGHRERSLSFASRLSVAAFITFFAPDLILDIILMIGYVSALRVA